MFIFSPLVVFDGLYAYVISKDCTPSEVGLRPYTECKRHRGLLLRTASVRKMERFNYTVMSILGWITSFTI